MLAILEPMVGSRRFTCTTEKPSGLPDADAFARTYLLKVPPTRLQDRLSETLVVRYKVAHYRKRWRTYAGPEADVRVSGRVAGCEILPRCPHDRIF